MSFEKRLIDEVRSHDILYNLSSADYRNVLAKANVWKFISRRLGVSDEQAKKRWKNLRDVYKKIKERQKLQFDGAAPVYKKKWRFYEHMRFLDSVAFTNNTMGNLDENMKVEIVESPRFEEILFPEHLKSPLPSPLSSPLPSPLSSPAPLLLSSPPLSPLPCVPPRKRRKRQAVPKQFYNPLQSASQPLAGARTTHTRTTHTRTINTLTSSTRQLCDALATRIENAGLTNDETGIVELALTECVINKIKEIKNMRSPQ